MPVRPIIRRVIPLVMLVAGCEDDGDRSGNASAAVTASVTFEETTERALRDQDCGSGPTRGCYTNYAVVADLDGDGQLDLVMANGGGHFVPSQPEPQSIFFGDGRGGFANGASAFGGIERSIVRQVAIADFDGDGMLDVYFPGGYGLHDDQLFMQVAPRRFENDPSRLPGSRRSRAGAVHAGDIDNDGDMDLLIADWGPQPNPNVAGTTPVKIRVLENDGHGRFIPRATLDAPEGTTATDIDLQDVNGDFALDIVLTQRNGQSRLYLNDGRGNFTDVTRARAFPPKRGRFTFNAELCDVDGDGDLDLLFDGGARFLTNHATQLLINDGNGNFVDETEARLGFEPSTDDNQVKCADVDGDGDFDLVVASLVNPTEKVFRNDGRGHFELVERALPPLRDPTLTIDLGDFDNDGRMDLMTAQGEVRNEPWLDRIFRNTSAAPDRNRPIFRAVEHPRGTANRETILRVAVSDAHTSETGQHVRRVFFHVRIDGRQQDFPARFMGGDIFRAVVPPEPARTTLEITPHAVDRMGNEAIGAPFQIHIGG